MTLRRRLYDLLAEGSACSDCHAAPALFYVERSQDAPRNHAMLCEECAESARRAGQSVVPRSMLAPFQP